MMPHAAPTTVPSVYLATNMNITNATQRKIDSFSSLKPGWNYGQGGPISKITRDRATTWLRFVNWLGFSRTNAIPGVNDDIVVSSGIGEHYIEVVIEGDGSISVIYSIGRRRVSSK